MRESKDITREELLNMVGSLRGALFIGDPPLSDLSGRELDEMQEEHTQLYRETAFDLSDCEGDVKTASEKIAELEETLLEKMDDPEDIERLVRRGWFGSVMTAAELKIQGSKTGRSFDVPPEPEQVERSVKVPDPEEDVVYWSCDDGEEHLSHEDPDDAIEEFCDDWLNPTMTPEQVLEVLPEEVTVYGFARMKPFLLEDESLDHVLEVLDEEYGDPDGGNTEPTKAMIEAEKKFHDVVVSEYESWACKKVCEKTVNTKAWIEKNRPDWLE